MACAPSEDLDQPRHPPSLIRVFTVRMKKAWVLSYPLRAQWRLIRLGGCPDWFESSLVIQVILLVLSWGGSNILFSSGDAERVTRKCDVRYFLDERPQNITEHHIDRPNRGYSRGKSKRLERTVKTQISSCIHTLIRVFSVCMKKVWSLSYFRLKMYTWWTTMQSHWSSHQWIGWKRKRCVYSKILHKPMHPYSLFKSLHCLHNETLVFGYCRCIFC